MSFFEKHSWLLKNIIGFLKNIHVFSAVWIYYAGRRFILQVVQLICSRWKYFAGCAYDVRVFCAVCIFFAGCGYIVQGIENMCRMCAFYVRILWTGDFFFAECIFILQKDSTSCKIIRHPAKKKPPAQNLRRMLAFYEKKGLFSLQSVACFLPRRSFLVHVTIKM